LAAITGLTPTRSLVSRTPRARADGYQSVGVTGLRRGDFDVGGVRFERRAAAIFFARRDGLLPAWVARWSRTRTRIPRS
jgi:hypothetical protein